MISRFLHRGISARAFERRFELADFVQVRSASFDHGLLTIVLEREVPEAMKSRRIEIAQGPPMQQIEGPVGEHNAA